MYRIAVSGACRGTDHLFLDIMVQYAGQEIKMKMLSSMGLHYRNSLRQAEELALFEQSMELEVRVMYFGKAVFNMVEPPKKPRKMVPLKKQLEKDDLRRCYICGELGHIKVSY